MNFQRDRPSTGSSSSSSHQSRERSASPRCDVVKQRLAKCERWGAQEKQNNRKETEVREE